MSAQYKIYQEKFLEILELDNIFYSISIKI